MDWLAFTRAALPYIPEDRRRAKGDYILAKHGKVAYARPDRATREGR